jgi:hypothetical protein
MAGPKTRPHMPDTQLPTDTTPLFSPIDIKQLVFLLYSIIHDFSAVAPVDPLFLQAKKPVVRREILPRIRFTTSPKGRSLFNDPTSDLCREPTPKKTLALHKKRGLPLVLDQNCSSCVLTRLNALNEATHLRPQRCFPGFPFPSPFFFFQ